MSSARVVLVTAPDRGAALALARGLVADRLVACVNVVPSVTSVYRWQGAVEEDEEALLVIKTRADRVAELEAAVTERHPYDVPEFVALAPEHVAPAYLAWLEGEAAAGGEGAGA